MSDAQVMGMSREELSTWLEVIATLSEPAEQAASASRTVYKSRRLPGARK